MGSNICRDRIMALNRLVRFKKKLTVDGNPLKIPTYLEFTSCAGLLGSHYRVNKDR